MSSPVLRAAIELFPRAASKSQLTQMKILKGAIRSYLTVGFDRTTFDTVAKASKVSRSLVQHYFADKRDIFEKVILYVRSELQETIIAAVGDEKKPEAALRKYVQGNFEWARANPDHVQVWMLFLCLCKSEKNLFDINTDVVRMGHDRIQSIVKSGHKKIFRCKDVMAASKMIQTVISGAMLTVTFENPAIDSTRYEKMIIDLCMEIARGKV